MNLNNYCPVQASIDSYLAYCAADDALDDEIEREKSDLWNDISAETIAEAMCEVPDSDAFYVDIRNAITEINKTGRCDKERAEDICRSFWGFVDDYLEKEAKRRINDRIEEGKRYKDWCDGGYRHDYR